MSLRHPGDGLANTQGSSCRWRGRIEDMNHSCSFNYVEVIHQATIRGQRLGSDTGPGRVDIRRIQFRDQPL
jgi:hypothetical protein